MIEWDVDLERVMPVLVWASAAIALVMAAVVVVERAEYALQQAFDRRVTARYRPAVRRAMAGDDAARKVLVRAPARHRIAIAWLVIEPLIEDRDPARIAAARAIAQAMSLLPIADRYLRSPWWWRRARALRALGLIQATDHTPQLVAALDDAHADVRAAALDGLTDMHDLTALEAIVVRVHDTSLHRGRRGAALKKLGPECEPFLLELSAVDLDNRLNYVYALAICGTAESRPVLCRWTKDDRVEVRATAFEALAYVGVDEASAQVALEGLESDDPQVRAMAAYALMGWQGPGDAAARLAAHLDDTWAVAVRAARSLQSMGPAGAAQLQARASRQDFGGLLARQMLWTPAADAARS
jgi:HEAT repeat protein